MRAMQIRALGAPLKLHDIAMPEPGVGEVRVRVRACGLNFADTLVQVGKYQEKFDLPVTPGMELCGVIDALGEGMDGFSVGQRVAANPGHGGLADYAVVPASACVPISDDMPDADAAAFLVAYASSHMALDHRAHLQPGERLLVLGASGGVGLTAVELGKLMGAEVIACARGADKLEIARKAGADHLIDSDADDLREAVLDLGGADVVYDPIGGDLFTAAMRACNPEARILPIGFASGTVPQIPANILLVKNLTVIGFYVGGYKRFAPHVLTRSFAKLIAWYDAGKLRPHVSNVLPLDRANDGLELLRSRKATGKVVIEITAD
ncbi:NADPH:quinone oxidoreductase family protein [Pseudosulfitobacter koreensis]|uniref:NADPH:quinone oxidoreductase family protein n=1 Tax=Pseudosulfitobacter koreensis TaxID=2968472 RepID=A0ABT1YYU2_9RHOB|nr:NADPH:quinone oxidoreductase family protein [Pseudosulfitobacter koreense]MCR8826055.1 NADPH:quinone oxidoreductase family protein [Pseudosulfitobacter koreense]